MGFANNSVDQSGKSERRLPVKGWQEAATWGGSVQARVEAGRVRINSYCTRFYCDRRWN